MKITVWTSWQRGAPLGGEPKCIFIGETEILPRIGEHVGCREGFGCETVSDVIIDLNAKEAEIHVENPDANNEYGLCLIKHPPKTA